MKEEIIKVKEEVITAQKESVVREVATLEIQLAFMTAEHKEKLKGATKELKEQLSQFKLQKLIPMQDNIAYKTNYYEYLCGL